jgi:hypothetical protein
MAQWMSCKGVGSRFSARVRGTTSKRGGLTRSVALTLLVASTLAAGTGCSTSQSEAPSAQPAATAEQGSGEQGSGEPEQVVQRMAPEPASGASSIADNHASDEHAAKGHSVDTRLSAAGVRRADSRPSSAGEPITSKHLEAELNRLEAELGN